jgi:broad specificity phosphatase PhoE
MFVPKNHNAPSYHITYLRHAESVGNLHKYHQGQVDYPLTEVGKKQAMALAERWQKETKHFDYIISSSLSRACQTAEIIAKELYLPVETEDIWIERNNGRLGGLNSDEAEKKHPRPPFINPYMKIGETGESQWELYLRAGHAVQGLINRPPGNYLIVSHGAILNMILYVILGITPQADFQGPRFRFPNTAFATAIYRPDTHTWFLTGLYDRRHWDFPKDKDN